MIYQTRTRAKWTLGAVALIALSGCNGNREAQVTGNWKVRPTTFTMPTPAAGAPTNAAAQQMGQQMAQNMMNSMTLDLKADKNFTMNMMFPDGRHLDFNGQRCQFVDDQNDGHGHFKNAERLPPSNRTDGANAQRRRERIGDARQKRQTQSVRRPACIVKQ
jgi:hypothetical protein